MTPEQFQRVEEVFVEACELPTERRASYLDEHCAGDGLVREEVEAMLAADEYDAPRLSSIALPRPGLETMIDGDAATRAASIPERIGRYRILRECGHGGMGVVYEAEQENPSRRVALKIIRSGIVSAELLRRFRTETEVLGRLQHPGIAQIFEAGSSSGGEEAERGGQPFIAMEFVEGTELLEYASSRPLDTRARLELFARVCDAVQHAHERGVVHRDLKPANILVVSPTTGTLAQEVGQPKILDFGVARMTHADMPGATMLTNAGQLVGTLQYMSPEQASEGRAPIDARSDVYALGVLLYELLSGRLPYDLGSLTIPESVVVVREREAQRLGSIEPRLAGDIDTIVGKCLEKEPERRYPSAAALAEDIRRHLHNEPIGARPPTRWYQVKKFARRNRALVGGVLATLLALVIGLIASLRFAWRAQQNAALAEANEIRALESETAALRRAYIANLTAASALVETDPLLAREQLAAAPLERRDWEWHYLSSQLRRYSRTYAESAFSPGPLAHLRASVDIAFTPDGSRLVAALEDGRVGVWDPVTTELVRVGGELAGATIRALDVPVSGRQRVACGTYDGRVRVWDLGEDRWMDVHDGEEAVWFVAWDRSGERLLFLTPTFVGLWTEGEGVREHAVGERLDKENVGQESWDLRYERPRNLTFTADGARFAATTRAGDFIAPSLWDADTGARLYPADRDPADLRGFGEQMMRSMAVASHDRQRIATMSGLRSASVLDSGTLTEELVLRGHRNGVRKLGWTTDDERIVSSSHDGTVRVWSAADGAALDVIEADPASPLAIAPDGSGVVYRTGGALRFWDFGSASTVLHPDTSYVYAVAYSPDGSRLAAGSVYSDNVTLFDARTRRTLWTVDTGAKADRLLFTPDGRRLITHGSAEPGGPLVAIDTETAEVHLDRTPPIEEWPARDRRGVRQHTGFVVSPDGGLLAVSPTSSWESGDAVVVRNLATNEVLLTLEGACWGVAFSPDGAQLAAAFEFPGRIEVWDIARGERVVELLAHGSHAYCVDFHPDGTRLASGGNDNTIRLWDTTTWEAVLELRGHSSYVMALDFSPDGTQLASGSGDLTVRIWDSLPRDERLRQQSEPR